MIVSSDGELIAAPGLAKNGVVDAQTLVRAQTREGVADVVRRIRTIGSDAGALRHGDRLIAYGRLKEPDWYFLMSFPSDDLVWSAVKTASWVLLFGVLGVIIQVALLYRVMRITVERPLRVLADAHRTGRWSRPSRSSTAPTRSAPWPAPCAASATAISSCCARWRSGSPSAPPSWSAPIRPSRCSWPTCPTSCARR